MHGVGQHRAEHYECESVRKKRDHGRRKEQRKKVMFKQMEQREWAGGLLTDVKYEEAHTRGYNTTDQQ